MKQSPLESEIQNTICEYLSYRKHFFWRSNSTGLYDSVKKSFRTPSKWSRLGVPDILLVKEGILYGLEVKRHNTHQSESQKVFEKELTKAGGRYFVVRSVDEVIALGL